jgi:hypothetical protein
LTGKPSPAPGTMRILLLIAILSGHLATASPQQLTLFSLETLPSATDGNPGITHLSAALAVPLTFAGVRMTHGVSFKQMSKGFQTDAAPATDDPTKLYEVRYEVTARFGLSDKWSALVYLGPGLSADARFDSPRANDFDFRSALVLQKPLKSGSLGFGASYRNRMDLAVVPIFLMDTYVSPRVHLDIAAPARATAWYESGPRRAGLTIRYTSKTYGLPSASGSRLDHKVLAVGAEAESRLSGPLSVRGTLGYALSNNLEYSSGSEEETIKLGSGMSFGFALLFSAAK